MDSLKKLQMQGDDGQEEPGEVFKTYLLIASTAVAGFFMVAGFMSVTGLM